MDRIKIERLTASLAVTFLTIATLGAILLSADVFFNWDIFSLPIQKALGFILLSLGLVIFSAVIVNIMINIGVIAQVAQKILRQEK